MIKILAPYISAALLFAAWFALVLLHQTPPADFVTALTGALAGLSVHGIHQAKDAVAAKAAGIPSSTTKAGKSDA